MSKYTSEDINNTIKAINQDRTLLDMLLEVDGLLEHLGLYAFKNWKKGKVVEVGRPSKYWIDLTLMYDEADMPDPEGALRLTNKDCKVKFNKDNKQFNNENRNSVKKRFENNFINCNR